MGEAPEKACCVAMSVTCPHACPCVMLEVKGGDAACPHQSTLAHRCCTSHHMYMAGGSRLVQAGLTCCEVFILAAVMQKGLAVPGRLV